MTVSTERIRELRNRFATGSDMVRHAPQEVWRTSKDLTSIINELLEYRDAEAQAEAKPERLFAEEQAECERTEDIYGQPVTRENMRETTRVPLEGVVS